MSKYIHLDERVKNELLHVFENLKDKYVPNNANEVLIGLKIKDAIENDSLTTDTLLEFRGCEKYNDIMNILRAAYFNFDITRFMEE